MCSTLVNWLSPRPAGRADGFAMDRPRPPPDRRVPRMSTTAIRRPARLPGDVPPSAALFEGMSANRPTLAKIVFPAVNTARSAYRSQALERVSQRRLAATLRGRLPSGHPACSGWRTLSSLVLARIWNTIGETNTGWCACYWPPKLRDLIARALGTRRVGDVLRGNPSGR